MIPPIILIRSAQTGAALACILLTIAALGITNEYFLLRQFIMCTFFSISIFFTLLRVPRVALGNVALAILFNPYYSFSISRDMWIIVDLIVIALVAYMTYWATSPYKKGMRFEQYVTTLFPQDQFSIVDRTRDTSKFLDRRVESDSHPDFVFKNRSTGKIFAVECKWRRQWTQGNDGGYGLWWNNWQWRKYMNYQTQTGTPVYVAFGIGGTPEKPKEVYFLELERLHYTFLKQDFVRSGKVAGQMF